MIKNYEKNMQKYDTSVKDDQYPSSRANSTSSGIALVGKKSRNMSVSNEDCTVNMSST